MQLKEILSCLLVFTVFSLGTAEDWRVALRMPQVRHTEKDVRICSSIQLPERDGFIVGFEHVGPSGVVHHLFAYGCDEPAGTTWECGVSGPKCRNSPGQLMYAWANDAPPLVLPEGVGYQLNERVRYIVAELHYGHESSEPDSSGIDIIITDRTMPYHAGIYVLIPPSIGRLPTGDPDVKFTENCVYRQSPITAFAYRVHTHGAGKVVWGKKIDKNDRTKETLLGSRDPQLPQSFIPMEQEVPISRGDLLKAQCSFNMTGKPTTHIGSGMANEMCNFYIMGYAPHPITTMACSGGFEFQL